jgi:predicted ArsR family transcriptional regulator
MTTRTIKGRNKDASARLARIVDLIADKPMTMREIAQAIGMDRTSVRRYLFSLQLTGLVHIGDWTTPERGRPAARFLAGSGENAPQPAGEDQTREYDFDPLEQAMRRANQAKAASIKPFRDPLTAALFGDAQ